MKAFDARGRRAPGVAWLFALLPGLLYAQEVQFQPPAAAGDATLPAIMRDLAERIVPVYQDDDLQRYLRNLSALQLVAGAAGAANSTRESLRSPPAGAADGQTLWYDAYTHARAIEATDRVPFAEAMSKVIARLSDRDAYTLLNWRGPTVAALRDALQKSFDAARGKGALSLTAGTELVRTYLAFEVASSVSPLLSALQSQDDLRRYLTEGDVPIKMPDGMSISALVVRPKRAPRDLPTLLELKMDGDSKNAAEESAAHGYAAVVAYVRGTHLHGGRVAPYQFDGEAARAVINWIELQGWSDGRVGMYGSRYSGFTPWAAAKRLPPALKAIATSGATAPGIDFPMVGNIPLNAAYPWSLVVTGRAAGNADNPGATSDADPKWELLNQTWYRSGHPYQTLDRLGGVRSRYFHRWINHPSYDRFWQKMIPFRGEFAHIGIPVLAITGYYDRNEAGTLYYFAEHYRYNPRADQTLVIGPYDNDGVQDGPSAALRGYAVDPAALVDLRELRYRWFDYIFKGAAKPSVLTDRVNFEVMGANEWRHARSLDAMAAGALRFYLDAAPSAGAHLLARRKSSHATFVPQTVNLTDRSDATGVPSSNIFVKSLPTPNALTFVSEPLARAIEVNGLISGELDLFVNKMDLDLNISLYEQLPSGDYLQLFRPAYEFRASYSRDRVHRHLLKAGERQQLPFKSERMTSRKLQAGSRVVVVLGVNKRPDQEINYGTGDNVSEDSIDDGRTPIRIRWYNTSYIDIPTGK